MIEFLTDYTLRNVTLGSALLGLVGGVLGTFAVLRRQSLLGDALAHAALPGLCLAFLLTGSKAPLALLIGGGLAGWVAALGVLAILRTTRLGEDAALGVTLSSFFGFGVTLLTFIQHGGDASQAGLDKFLFGQAATIIASDVLTFAVLGGAALLVVALLYKQFKLVTFDPDYAASLGLPVGPLGTLLTSLTVLAVMIGLQTVGVVLMAAMLIAPASAARQWTDRLSTMLILAGTFGAASGLIGALISSTREGLPTGPLVILAVSAITVVSLLFAPLRGVVPAAMRDRRNRDRLRRDRLLLDAHVLHTHDELTPLALARRRGRPEPEALADLQRLESLGLAVRDGDLWRLTRLGDEQAHHAEQVMRDGRFIPAPQRKEVTP